MWHKIQTIFVVMLLVIVTATPSADARNYNNKKSKDNPKYASLVMDADSGRILSQRYADKVLHPASLTKMMTMLLAFEAMDRGHARRSTRIRISRHAASMPPSKIGLKPGSTIRLDDALKILATKSANDIAVAVAEHLGKTESRFASRMTARARSIGMQQTRFKNASGLHHKYQVTTARDMAKLAQYILQRYPHHYHYFSTRSFTYKGKTYKNHNRLLGEYAGMDGFKTGYINASGFNLVASAHRNGRRLIGVVFGGRSSKTRNTHMASILDKGFRKAKGTRTARLTPPPLPPSKPTYGIAKAQPIPTMPPQTGQVKVQQATSQQGEQNLAYASLSSLNAKNKTKITASSQTHTDNNITPNYTALTAALQNGAFGEMIGEGDFDPSVSKRLETGLIAVAVHKGDYRPNPAPATAVEQSLRAAGHAMVNKIGQSDEGQKINVESKATEKNISTIPHPKDIVGRWSVQIGAYTSRLKTDEALRMAKNKLPPHLNMVNTMTVPLKTQDGMIFRARLGGMNETQARQVCQYFKDCIPVAPIATQISAQ